MASYLRPRRGKEATAKSQNIVLKRGEVFFETPSGGVGTGIGKIKMGDGSTSYASLPYFLRQLDLNDNNTKCAFTNATAATDKSNNTTYLNNIAPSNNLKTLFQNIKQLLLNYNSQLTSLNNDLESISQSLDGVIIYKKNSSESIPVQNDKLQIGYMFKQQTNGDNIAYIQFDIEYIHIQFAAGNNHLYKYIKYGNNPWTPIDN